ncbi:MAG TPA: deoxyribose-phosphate aldolase [Patescibacteria group bacterium]|nr:deoxyribose-phosphate aldolase [Patescibacteria group bacterium]
MDTTTRTAHRALAALDLTSLNEADTPDDIVALCARARTRHGTAAAVCVYPEHVSTAHRVLADAVGAAVRVATVVNFPDGSADPARAERETRRAIAAGADEIDVVFPWRALIAGDAAVGARVVSDCKAALPAGARLKVILETGELKDASLIRRACDIALAHGADFLKTSTGKVPVNATPEAARIMAQAILDAKSTCGLKVAGGVRRVADAAIYFELVDALMGSDWATPDRFRIGASGLLDDILGVLSGGAAPSGTGY